MILALPGFVLIAGFEIGLVYLPVATVEPHLQLD